MDTHNVSHISQYHDFLLQHKRRLQDAESRKGRPPMERKTRDEVIEKFNFNLMMSRMNMMNMTSGPKGSILSTFVPPAYLPCHSPFCSLTKTSIKNLLLETHHRGTYLLLRTATQTNRINGIMAIVEDEDGEAVIIQLYHQEKSDERANEEIIYQGAILIVKDPYLKLLSDGNYGLRVDHLSDVVFLPEYDERVPNSWQQTVVRDNASSTDWKAFGNDFFNTSKYHAAIQCYTKALSCSPTEEGADILRRNRSLAFIKTKQFDPALCDLEYSSSMVKPAENALYRKSQALYSLRKYLECSEVLKVLLQEYPSNKEAKYQLSRANDRTKEQETGKYQFKQLYKQALKLRPPHLDLATYIGPVCIKESGSRGRGLFTTQAVKVGDLLLCEKAFAQAFVGNTNNAEQNQSVTLLINPETESITMGAQAELIRLIAQMLYKNPSLASIINDLHHGSYKPVGVSEVDGKPVVDTFLIERIISINVFGCPLSSRDSHMKTFPRARTHQEKKAHHSCGIWPTASYINHSCYSNARRSFIGDVMIVRATRDLEPDTEITFWYQSPVDEDYTERQRKFKNWEFKCDCTICQDARATNNDILAERTKLKADALKALNSLRSSEDIDRLETILKKMTDTYTQPASEVPRLGMWDPLLALSLTYMDQGKPIKAINSAFKVLESLGYVIEGSEMPRTSDKPMVVKRWGLMMEYLVDCWILLSSAYSLVAPDLKDTAEQYARISYKICVGEDETFDETYKIAKP